MAIKHASPVILSENSYCTVRWHPIDVPDDISVPTVGDYYAGVAKRVNSEDL